MARPTVWRAALLTLAATLLLSACAATASPGATANELAQSERIGRLTSERAAAIALAQKERPARIDAEVKVAVLEQRVAIGEYNFLLAEGVCDHVRGIQMDAATMAKFDAAAAHVQAFLAGCGKDEPGDACVARKAREAAR